MSGLSNRMRSLYNLLKEAGINPEAVSYANTIRCLTKSKSILTYKDYKRCGKHILDDIDKNEVEAILCFGVMPARIVLEVQADRIDKFRGKSYHLNEGFRVVVVTYSLSVLVGKGCSGCGRTVFPHLMAKDLIMFRNELVKKRIIE